MIYLLRLVFLGALAWYGYGKYTATRSTVADASSAAAVGVTRASRQTVVTLATPTSPQFSCDGRTYCSQMRSSAEATYFLQHCPSTKMDGDADGVPCESQWCR